MSHPRDDTSGNNIMAIMIIAIFGGITGAGCWLTQITAIHKERTSAVKAGVGHWVVNPDNGRTEFKYGARK